MLERSFLHFVGIGPKKERAFWKAGKFSWDDIRSNSINQLHLFNGDLGDDSILREFKNNYASGNANYFADKLSRREHYRIAMTYPSETMFLDIETTGLSRTYDEITLIGWGIGSDYGVLIKGDSPKRFFKDLSKCKAIVTFNGSIFDFPFVQKTYTDTIFPRAHVDLRFLCKRVGMAGGQKNIEGLIPRRFEGSAPRKKTGQGRPVTTYASCSNGQR